MNASHAIALIAVSVLIVVAVEESRIATLRNALTAVENSPELRKPAANSESSASRTTGEEPAPPPRTKSRPEMKPETAPKAAATPDESFAKAVRKMWDNPAGKSMMSQGVKMAVAMMYQDFIDGLELPRFVRTTGHGSHRRGQLG